MLNIHLGQPNAICIMRGPGLQQEWPSGNEKVFRKTRACLSSTGRESTAHILFLDRIFPDFAEENVSHFMGVPREPFCSA